MRLVNDRLAVKAKMLPPNHRGYILLAAEVDRVKPFGRPSPAKRQILADAKTRLGHLAQRAEVLDATLFRAVLIAPGEGIELIQARAGKVHHARYDLVGMQRPHQQVEGVITVVHRRQHRRVDLVD